MPCWRISCNVVWSVLRGSREYDSRPINGVCYHCWNFTFYDTDRCWHYYEFQEFISIPSSKFYGPDRDFDASAAVKNYPLCRAVKVVSLTYFCIVLVYFDQYWIDRIGSEDSVRRRWLLRWAWGERVSAADKRRRRSTVSDGSPL
jgi:hypothetical protein